MSNYIGTPAPQQQKPKDRKVLKYGATAVVSLFIGVGIGQPGHQPATAQATATPTVTVTATITKTQTVTAAPKAPASTQPASTTIPGDGTYQVGKDIPAGTYKSSGASASGAGDCYWERAKDASGSMDSIIANNNSTGQSVVTVNAGEFFTTQGCNTWVKVG